MEINFSLVLTLIVLISILIVFLVALAKTRDLPTEEVLKIQKQLDEVKYLMSLNNPAVNRDGIVRLDAMLSKSLQLKNKNTLNCGDNLKISKVFIGRTYYEDIWHFHKLRNSIVHENIEISNQNAIDAYRVYSSVINKLLK